MKEMKTWTFKFGKMVSFFSFRQTRFGAAWEKNFSRTDFSPNIYFERTGCLLTLDGSEDHRVNIEGMPDYKPVFVAQDADDSDEEGPASIAAAPEPISDVEPEDDSDIEVQDSHTHNENQNLDMIRSM